LSRLFCQDQDQGQDFYFQDQDQDSESQDQDEDQDFIFCPRGASRPRLWSRELHHCVEVSPNITHMLAHQTKCEIKFKMI